MKKTIFSLFVLASMSTFVSCKNDATVTTDSNETVVASADAVTYKIDKANSIADWKASKPGTTHTGTLNFMDGEAIVADGKLEGGKFVFDMSTITVTDLKPGEGKEDLEIHLKGTGEKEKDDHFFNTVKYPKGSFEVTSVTEENGKSMITGNLVLKEISKSITFPAVITSDEESMTIKSEPFMINRTEWNINFKSKTVFDDLKDKFVDDNIELTVTVKVLK